MLLSKSSESLAPLHTFLVQILSVSSGALASELLASAVQSPTPGIARSLRRSTVTRKLPSEEKHAWLTYGVMGSSTPPSPLTWFRGATARSHTCASRMGQKS